MTPTVWLENLKTINHLEETGRDIRSLVKFVQVDSGWNIIAGNKDLGS